MYDIAIVGSGYWGTAMALTARWLRLKVWMVDSAEKEGASRNASAHFSFSWYKKPWLGRIQQAVERARFFGLDLRQTGAWIGKTVAPGVHSPKLRNKPDWHLFSPQQFLDLRPPDVVAPVLKVEPGTVHLSDGPIYARHVYVAAGAWTDNLLLASGLPRLGVSGLPGAGLIIRAAVPGPGPVYLHELNPYKQIGFRPWTSEGLIRVGETVEQVPGKQEEYLTKMRKQVRGIIGPADEVEVVRGIRPLTDAGPQVTPVGRGVIAATGGGRIGALMSFWAADTALRIWGLM